MFQGEIELIVESTQWSYQCVYSIYGKFIRLRNYMLRVPEINNRWKWWKRTFTYKARHRLKKWRWKRRSSRGSRTVNIPKNNLHSCPGIVVEGKHHVRNSIHRISQVCKCHWIQPQRQTYCPSYSLWKTIHIVVPIDSSQAIRINIRDEFNEALSLFASGISRTSGYSYSPFQSDNSANSEPIAKIWRL